jgi:hypothetical protein
MFANRFARYGVHALALAAAAVTLPACATVTRGTNQNFTVESTPPGASVATSNGFACDATPCSFRMPRKDGFTVTLTMPGYDTVTTEVGSQFSGAGGAAMAGNLLIGGVIGGAVDATSGALNDLKPNPLQVTLYPTGTTPVAPAATASTGTSQ